MIVCLTDCLILSLGVGQVQNWPRGKRSVIGILRILNCFLNCLGNSSLLETKTDLEINFSMIICFPDCLFLTLCGGQVQRGSTVVVAGPHVHALQVMPKQNRSPRPVCKFRTKVGFYYTLIWTKVQVCSTELQTDWHRKGRGLTINIGKLTLFMIEWIINFESNEVIIILKKYDSHIFRQGKSDYP